MDNDKLSHLFFSLIYSFQMQTMMSLGKIKNPVTDKSEKDLAAAQMTIDIIDMIKEKTKNNLSEQENKFIDQALADLKLNYVHESSNKEENKEETSKKNKEESKEENK
ncbi:MAG: DUF1844 domain-containing protein [Ignavibacteriae bacterium]|nr:DUF1844 domain-containing protein [Ignavibacteriota bacterium]